MIRGTPHTRRTGGDAKALLTQLGKYLTNRLRGAHRRTRPPERSTDFLINGIMLSPLATCALLSWLPYVVGPSLSSTAALLVLGLSVSVGLPFVYRLPLRRRAKHLVALAYVSVATVAVVVLAFFFACSFYGDCL
jgi:hypothetical protein